MHLNEKIRITRLSKNLSQENIAQQLNISQPAYQKIECGKTCISAVNIIRLSDILEYDFHSFLRNTISDNKCLEE